jgi:hypothetical protein
LIKKLLREEEDLLGGGTETADLMSGADEGR